MKKVDVIVPVYLGLNETKECLDSVILTMPSWANLIVINDCSPDVNITNWLREYAKSNSFYLLENEINLGFVATVNRGMSLNLDNDVLLLNSDVEVQNNWLERIKDVAYFSDEIGSVTPFSNNATICSYPNFCEDNKLVKNKTLKEIDDIFSLANRAEDYIEIPTGVGFCMYIKRLSLDDVGLFDVETFGKGYGEENDWCQRAISRGWKNVHAVNVFVYHKGGVSFANEQSPRQKIALELLLKKHPNYTADIINFVQKDPAKKARLQVLIEYIKSFNKTVLHLEHSLGGGVARHVNDLVNHLQPEILSVRLRQIGHIVELEFDKKNILKFDIKNDFELLISLLKYLNFNLIHYHHIHGMSESVVFIAKTLSIDYVITIHDYYFINGNPTLTFSNGVFFGDETEPDVIMNSLENQLPNFYFSSDKKHSELELFINNAKLIISPSKDTIQRFTRFYKDIERMVVVPHPENLNLSNIYKKESKSSDKIKVLVVGAISLEKGAVLLNDFSESFGGKYEIHLLGYSCISLNKKIIAHGKYKEIELEEKILKISPDVVWYTSQCAETYCYTLTLPIALGIPILAPNLGAFIERLDVMDNVILLDNYNRIEDIDKAICSLYAMGRKSEDVLKKNVVLKKEKTDYYKSEYLSLINCFDNNALYERPDIEKIFNISNVCNEKFCFKKKSYELVLMVYKTKVGRFVSKIVSPEKRRKLKRKLFG